jgi:hypothetical protein
VHPAYDPALERVYVLVTTGRLTGKAPLSASEFARRVASQHRGRFEVWDDATLREMLSGQREPSLPPSGTLVPVMGRISGGTLQDCELESLLAQLIPEPTATEQQLHRALLDNALVTATLRSRGLPFHALTAALNGVRICATRVHAHASDAPLIREAMTRYAALGTNVLAPLLEKPDDTRFWLEWCGGITGKLLAYPATCARTTEFLGLCSLRPDAPGAGESAALLARIAGAQPGVSRPISDRYATSLAPAVVSLVRHGFRTEASVLLRRTAKWLCDRYERSEFGLAGPYATPKEEADHLLGAPFEFVNLSPRRDSLLAVALADLSHTFLSADYGDIVNDMLAVGIIPSALHPHDVPEAYRVGAGAVTPLINIRYPDQPWSSPLEHQRLQGPRVLESSGAPDALLAMACLTRDRLFSDCYPRLLA